MATETAKSTTPSATKGPRNLREIGPLGLIVFDGTGYFYVTEEQWKGFASEKVAPSNVVVGVDDRGAAVFVNLDRIGPAPTESV